MPVVRLLNRVIRSTLAQALGLAYLMLIAVRLAREQFPYSEFWGSITDDMALPGAFILGVIYPQGMHTGNGVLN